MRPISAPPAKFTPPIPGPPIPAGPPAMAFLHSAKAPRSAEARWPRHESPRAVVTEIDLARGRDVEVGVGVHFHSGVKPLRAGAAVLGRVHGEFRGAPRIIEMDRQQIADPDFLLA